MQKCYLLIVCFITLFTFSVNAATNDIESLIFTGDFTAAEKLIIKKLADNHLSTLEKITIHRLEGEMKKIAGDIDGAYIAWQKANRLNNQLYSNKNDYHHAWKYALLSNYHYEKINSDLAKTYADSCLTLIQHLTLEQQKEIEIYKIWNILAQSYKQQEHKTKAQFESKYKHYINYYELSEKFQLEHSTPVYYLAKTYHLLGNAHLDMIYFYLNKNNVKTALDCKDKALMYYQKAIDIWKKQYGNTHYELGKTTFLKGLLFYYLALNNNKFLPIAIENFKEATTAFGLNYSQSSLNSLNKIPNKEDLLMCLKYYTISLLELHNDSLNNLTYLTTAEKVNQLALNVWKEIHIEQKNSNTNQNLAIYGLIPQLEQMAILFFKKPNNEELKNKFFTINQQLKYYDLFKNNPIASSVTIAKLQQQLVAGQVFMDFHYNSVIKTVYVLQITSTESKLIPLNHSFLKNVQTYKKAIIEMNYDAFTDVAQRTFNALFPDGISDIKELVICPDMSVANIPFEALLCSDTAIPLNDYRKLDYLINHLNIRYVLSPSTCSNKLVQTNWSFNVFTPEFTTTNFAELPFSARFGKQAQKELKANLFNGNEATTTALKNTPNNLLHISTHAVISDEVALNYMQFADAPFYQKEVADLKHVPQLTVVNTCNSGMGRKLQGDGINGFVRELHKVGVLATLANLWEVDDQASNQLFFTFYKELKTGANTLEALRKSKLTHIKNAANSKLAAPYYWAGHQLVGNNIAVTQHANYWWWIILGSSFIGFACWWLMKLFKVPSIN